jgi:hypothetical protein
LLATKYHRDWERCGAATVIVPYRFTPHGFWSRRIAKKSAYLTNDKELIDLLQKNGVETPVINFHP